MLIQVAVLAAAAASQPAAPQASSPSTLDAGRPAASPPPLPTYSAPELAELLRRVGDYVAEYERSFSDLVAEETYAQRMAGWRYDETSRGR